MDEKLKIFCCYAHQDQPLFFKLKAHLASLVRNGIINIWEDNEINSGIAWKKEVNGHLDAAHIILLLISPDFMASDYCYSKEMKRAMERHEQGTALVIPILLRPVSWKGMPFEKLQVLPNNARPITMWRNRDEAFLLVAQGIEQAAKLLPTKYTTASQISQQKQNRRDWGEARNAPAFFGRQEVLATLEHWILDGWNWQD